MKNLKLLLLLVVMPSALFSQSPAFTYEFPNGRCAPDVNVVFRNTSGNTENVNFYWNFGIGADEFPSNDTTRSFNYSSAGRYTVTLRAVYNNGTNETFQDVVEIVNSPTAQFDATVEGCVPTNITTRNSSILGDAPIIEHKWNFGDGVYVYGEEVQKYLTAEAEIPVYLKITDNNGCESTLEQMVNVYEKPSANFVVDKNFSCTPSLFVNPTPTHQNNQATTYLWNFGNSGISSEENPNAIEYARNGEYTLSLTSRLGENCFETESLQIHVGEYPATYSIFYGLATDDQEIISGQTAPKGLYIFRNTSNDTLNYVWNINGTTYENTNPSLVFCEEGTYTFSLTVGTELSCPNTVNGSINVSNSATTQIRISQGGNVVLTEAETGSIRFDSPYLGVQNNWSFNGEEKVGNYANYTMCEEGTFLIELNTSFNNECSDQLTREVTIVNSNDTTILLVQNGETVEGETAIICDGDVTLLGDSPFSRMSSWHFSNELIIDNMLDLTICEAGSYSVELDGSFTNGCEFHSSKNFEVRNCVLNEGFHLYQEINDNGDVVEIFDNDTICLNEQYYVEPDLPDHFIRWTFPTTTLATFDFFEPRAGFNTLGMITEKANGCIDTVKKTIYAAEVKADFALKDASFACPFPFETDFYNKSKFAHWYSWNVKYIVQKDTLVDSTFATQPTPHFIANFPYRELDSMRHTIDTTNILITLEASSMYGCNDYKTIVVSKHMPLARFIPSITWGCAPLTVNFESLDEPGFDFLDSTPVFNPRLNRTDTIMRRRYNEITSLYWDYGDGTVEHITGSELLSRVTNLMNRIKSAPWITPVILDNIEKYEREQSGYGIIHFTNEYFKRVLDPNAYTDFKAIWKDVKPHSNRIQEHIYQSPGKYQAKLIVEDSNGCRDTSYVVEIRVGRELDLTFDVAKSELCANESIQIITNSANNSFVDTWHYYSEGLHLNSYCSDNSEPTLPISPLHTGNFNITLRAGYNGCFTEVTNENIVTVLGPVGQFNYSMRCESPYDYRFVGDISGATSWTWNFGDNSPLEANSATPLHHYDTTGDYTVTLTTSNDTTGCPNYIHSHIVKARQIEAVSLASLIMCPNMGSKVAIDSVIDESESELIEPYAWYFNGIGYRRDFNGDFEAIFRDTGRLHITFVAMDENYCTDTLEEEVIIRKPKVEIETNQNFLCGLHDTATFRFVEFDSTLIRWRWDFGDFNEAYQFPSDSVDSVLHVYTIRRDQQYTVMLEAEDSIGCMASDTLILQAYYRTADFTMPSNTLCDIDTARFINIATELDSSYWHLGDTSFYTTETSVSHFYDNFGVYPIIHIAYYKSCQDSLYWQDSVGVGMPNANFYALDTVLCTREIAEFHMTNPLYDANGLWTILENAPFYNHDSTSYAYIDSLEFYRFYEAGDKKIKLRLDYGSCSDSSEIMLSVKGGYLDAENRITCVGDTVLFKDTLAFSDIYEWSIFTSERFDTTTVEPFLYKTFNERGKFAVRLVAKSEGCNDTIEKLEYVNIQKVVADYAVSKDTICYGEDVEFYHSANLYDAESGEWWLNESVSTEFVKDSIPIQPYTKLGIKTTKLIMRSSNGCVDTAIKKIFVGGVKPVLHANPDYICFGDTVLFSYTTTEPAGLIANSVEWFFGDGEGSALHAPEYVYTTRGQMKPKVFFTDSIGCRVPSDEKIITVASIETHLALAQNPVCISSDVTASNESAYYTSSLWSLNDTLTFSSTNFYLNGGIATPGLYNLKLISTDDKGCTDSDSVTLEIVDLPYIELIANDSICLDSSVIIEALYKEPATVDWFIDFMPDFRQGNPRMDSPLQTTIYSVNIEDEYGCRNADTIEVFVQQYPNHVVPNDTLMTIGDTLFWDAYSNIESSFIWETASDGISCLDCPTPKIYSFSSHTYHLTISDWCLTKEYDILVDVVPTTLFDVPTAFTPNGDGENDIAMLRGWGIKEIIEFSIYNRWGQLLYSTTSFDGGWDGTFKGKDQPMETYAFVAKVKTYLNETIEKQGYITLIR